MLHRLKIILIIMCSEQIKFHLQLASHVMASLPNVYVRMGKGIITDLLITVLCNMSLHGGTEF